ncbi:MAG: TetR/AcrR family transcriptional regulator [Novosphingobium sp.]|jgi:AcrR family transcriptional regulator|nr:TetR/AcrR family transcriptional regulator [Novosphingobium sp.]
MAVAPRRVGAENSATRALILDATEQLIREEGYASVSTRRVAARAGLKPSLVHYYFPTTDDLLLAMSRRGAEESDRMIDEALRSDDPLRALWRYLADPSRIAVALEFMALANHRKAVRVHMAGHCEAMREREVAIFRKALGERLAAAEGIAPEGLSVILAGIGRALVMEGGLGVTAGHDAARAFVEQWLDRLAPAVTQDGHDT